MMDALDRFSLAVGAGCAAALWLGAACGVSDANGPSDADAAGEDAAPEVAVELEVDAAGEPGPSYVFEPFAWATEAPDPAHDRLCAEAADPDGPGEEQFIDCAIEGETFVTGGPAAKDALSIWTWNLERGYHVDEQIALMRDDPEVPRPDVILVSEADRGCPRTDRRYIVRDIAEALGMSYVYAVEFVELMRSKTEPIETLETCEHGNAIIARYPLGNVRQIRHASNLSWYFPPERVPPPPGGEPRLGGRVAVVADMKVGEGPDAHIVHLYSIHFESNDPTIQAEQAAETAEDGASQPFVAIVGGDTNAPLYWYDLNTGTTADQTVAELFSRGYVDAHASLPPEERVTHPPALVLDLIFGRGFGEGGGFRDPGICPEEKCAGLSDHLPVWTLLDPGE